MESTYFFFFFGKVVQINLETYWVFFKKRIQSNFACERVSDSVCVCHSVCVCVCATVHISEDNLEDLVLPPCVFEGPSNSSC